MNEISDLNSLGKDSNSDRPGRRYFSCEKSIENSVKPASNYDPLVSVEDDRDKEEISNTFHPRVLCGTAIPIKLTNIGRYNPIAKRERGVLRGDSGMHILDPEEDTLELDIDYLS